MKKLDTEMKVRDLLIKPDLTPIKIEEAHKRLKNYEEYLCVVISIDDETPIQYYDEALVYMKYHKQGDIFVDRNDNDWGIDEILFVYLPTTGWISIKDALPPDKREYLCYGEDWCGYHVFSAIYDEQGWHIMNGKSRMRQFPTHWKLLTGTPEK